MPREPKVHAIIIGDNIMCASNNLQTSVIVMNPNDLQSLIRETLTDIFNSQMSRIQPEPETETLLKIGDVASLFQVSKLTIHNWKKQGRIPFRQIGRRIFYEKSEVLKELESLRNLQR